MSSKVITPHTPSHLAPLLALALSCLASTAHAEGAVRVFTCNVERVCNETGICETRSGEVEFRMEPVQLNANGAGSYQLAYHDNEITMHTNSDAGPFTWSLDGEQHTLLVNSETRLLWHRLAITPSIQATAHILNCTFSQ